MAEKSDSNVLGKACVLCSYLMSHTTFPPSLVVVFFREVPLKTDKIVRVKKQLEIHHLSLLLNTAWSFSNCESLLTKPELAVAKVQGSWVYLRLWRWEMFWGAEIRGGGGGVNLEQSQTINCSTLFCQDWNNPKLCIAGTEGQLPGRKSPEKSSVLFHWRILQFELSHDKTKQKNSAITWSKQQNIRKKTWRNMHLESYKKDQLRKRFDALGSLLLADETDSHTRMNDEHTHKTETKTQNMRGMSEIII